jgi:hypothetical protein
MCPTFQKEVQNTSNEVQLNSKGKATLVKVPSGLPEGVGKSGHDIRNCRNSSEIISGAWELNPDVCPKIGRLLRTSPEGWRELKTTSG